MMDSLGAAVPKQDLRPHPKLVRALDILFILHAEHELNCSTAAVRHVSSTNADVRLMTVLHYQSPDRITLSISRPRYTLVLSLCQY